MSLFFLTYEQGLAGHAGLITALPAITTAINNAPAVVCNTDYDYCHESCKTLISEARHRHNLARQRFF